MEFIINCNKNGAGVYKIKNNKDFRVYIGRSKHLKQRAEEHKKNFQAGRGNRKIKKFIKENPDAVFTFEVLAVVPNIEETEERYIKIFDSVRFGFNLVYNDYEIKQKFKFSIAEKKKEKPKKEKKPKPQRADLRWLQKTRAFKRVQQVLSRN